MTAQRKVGGRGYEKGEPRDIVLKLRLTQTEADILNDIAERANRPTTKIVMSAINSTFYFSALMQMIPMAEEQYPELKERFDTIRQSIKDYHKQEAEKAHKGDKASQLVLTAFCEAEITLLRFALKLNDWLDFEKERTPKDLLDI